MISQPTADKVRPESFDDMVGQEHLVGERGILRRMLASGQIRNMIFFGPPGTGKTTAANIIAKNSGMQLYRLNATTASLSDVREVIAQVGGVFGSGGILLYLDEIQYFNKKQQQSLLEYIEDGRVTLIASTTENPYFTIYDALLSRCSVFEFKPVPPAKVVPRLRAIAEVEYPDLTVEEDALSYLASVCGGDVRRSITLLEGVAAVSDGTLRAEDAKNYLPSVMAGSFDRDGDVHYDLLSSLQKSIRGSDPDATAFYLAKLLEGGDLLSVCRRLQVIASEDVGLAYPMAAAITYACCQSAKELGLPEARLPLANAAILLATSPKSNTAHDAVNAAAEDVRAGKGVNIPMHLRAPLFKGYKYPHSYPNSYVKQDYLPEDLRGTHYYRFGENKVEKAAQAYWEAVKGEKK